MQEPRHPGPNKVDPLALVFCQIFGVMLGVGIILVINLAEVRMTQPWLLFGLPLVGGLLGTLVGLKARERSS